MRTLVLATESLPRRLRLAVIALAAVTLGVGMAGGAAYAYFSATGSGNGRGSATAGFAAVTVSTSTTSGTSLYPTSTGDLVVSGTNPNPVDVKVTATGIVSTSGCTTPALTLNGTPSFTIPAHTTSAASFTLSGAVTMGASASNDCQGQTLTVTLSVAVQET